MPSFFNLFFVFVERSASPKGLPVWSGGLTAGFRDSLPDKKIGRAQTIAQSLAQKNKNPY
jgi:hypothetical protein